MQCRWRSHIHADTAVTLMVLCPCQSGRIDSAELLVRKMLIVMLTMCRNIGHDVSAPLTRVYATPLAQPIHTDSADMVALLCLRTGKEGGLSSWSSSVSVHNELQRLGRKVPSSSLPIPACTGLKP
jgi:hypothetical protein